MKKGRLLGGRECESPCQHHQILTGVLSPGMALVSAGFCRRLWIPGTSGICIGDCAPVIITMHSSVASKSL